MYKKEEFNSYLVLNGRGIGHITLQVFPSGYVMFDMLLEICPFCK